MPHSVLVCHVIEGNHIYFAARKKSKKIKNLTENGKVVLVCDEYSEIWSFLKGILVQGEGRGISNGVVFRKLWKLLYRKFIQYEIEPIEERKAVIIGVALR
jgi:hypothetical protein